MPPFLRQSFWSCCWVGISAGCLAAEVEPLAIRPVPSPYRVIELPGTVIGPEGTRRERTHHALSLDTDAPKPLLRSLGLTPTECSVRLRLPSRLSANRESANGLRLDVQAQAGIGCRF